MEWMVKIEGEQWVLQELSKSFNTSELCVFEDEQEFFLKYEGFDMAENAKDVLETAKRLVPVLSGATRLELGQSLSFGSVVRKNDDGTRQGFTFGWLEIETPRPILQISAAGEKVSNIADSVKSWIVVAQRNDKVTEALTLFGTNELNWVILYKVYEIIRDDLGGRREFRKIRWVAEDEERRFTQTAQPHRHAINSKKISEEWCPHDKPMTFFEGKAFIKTILHNWLSSKITKGRPNHA